MYKNKGREGSHNLCGTKVKYYRKRLPGHPSQNAFAKMAQLEGLDIDKNVIQRVVSGQRFVTDIDMKLCSMMNKGRLWPSFFVPCGRLCKHSQAPFFQSLEAEGDRPLETPQKRYTFHGFVGKSSWFLSIFHRIST